MSFDYATRRPRTTILLQGVALFTLLLFPSLLYALEPTSYAQEIQKYVGEDKVYLLETLRQKATRPSEQTVIDALLLEDGPQAIALYRKQLREYPDPAIDSISSSRIASYSLVIPDSDTTAKSALPPVLAEQLPAEVQDTTKHSVTPLARAVSSSKPQPPAAKDTTKLTAALQAKAIGAALRAPEKVKPLTTAGTCTLQFGSFSNRRNAEILAEKISGNIPVEVILHKGMHKVQLKTIYASHDEAVTAAKKLPFDSIVVPVR